MKVQTLETWWQLFLEKGKEKGQELRLRYLDWDHTTRFFTPLKINEAGTHIEGKLDSGEVINFPVTSQFWQEYHEGMEDGAKAV